MYDASAGLPAREGLSVGPDGHLRIAGADVPALAEKYGTPLYLVNEDVVRANCRRYLHAMRSAYGPNAMVAFAGKAMCLSAMYRLLAEEGMSADVVSGGEVYTAAHAGFDMSRVFFHGNNKTPAEIGLALEKGVGYFVVDNCDELALLARLAKQAGVKPRAILRVCPGIDAHTHSYIRTGQIDSKFGVALETGEALELAGAVIASPDVEYAGLHCHIASQVLDAEPFAQAAEVMTGLIAQIRDTFGAETSVLNLGGGFGIRYIDETPLDIEQGLSSTAAALKAALAKHGLPEPVLAIEPGRSIVAGAGITVYRVGHVKKIPGIRTYVDIDGGMTDNPRYILYQARYEFLLPEKAGDPRSETVTIAGRCCESGDLLGENVPLQPVEAGDLLCTLDTGAYCFSMSSHYNRVPGIPMAFVSYAGDRLVVRRESFADMVRNDIL